MLVKRANEFLHAGVKRQTSGKVVAFDRGVSYVVDFRQGVDRQTPVAHEREFSLGRIGGEVDGRSVELELKARLRQCADRDGLILILDYVLEFRGKRQPEYPFSGVVRRRIKTVDQSERAGRGGPCLPFLREHPQKGRIDVRRNQNAADAVHRIRQKTENPFKRLRSERIEVRIEVREVESR